MMRWTVGAWPSARNAAVSPRASVSEHAAMSTLRDLLTQDLIWNGNVRSARAGILRTVDLTQRRTDSPARIVHPLSAAAGWSDAHAQRAQPLRRDSQGRLALGKREAHFAAAKLCVLIEGTARYRCDAALALDIPGELDLVLSAERP